MLEPKERLYLIDIIKLTQNKSKKIQRYAKISKWLFNLSLKYKNKANMLALSGGNPEKFQNKIKNNLEKINKISNKIKELEWKEFGSFRGSIDDLSGRYKDEKEMKGDTYEGARIAGLVPAKPGFFKMTDDVPLEKREMLSKEKKEYTDKEVNEIKEVFDNISNLEKKAAQARKFYYKRKRKKFNPQKFNTKKEN